MYENVNPRNMHAIIEARAAGMEGMGWTLDEEATLGAVDVVHATIALGGTLADALELVRRVWESNAHKASS